MLPVPPSYQYTITPTKAEDDTACDCGVTLDDIVQARKFVLQIIQDAPSLRQVIAADVNRDGTITTTDISMMQNCKVQGVIPPGFQWWRFVSQREYNILNVHPLSTINVPFLSGSIKTGLLTQNLIYQDFYGIKLGDIIYHECTACGSDDGVTSSGTDRAAVSAKDLFLADFAPEPGQEYLIPIRAAAIRGLIVHSLELMFDPSALDVVSIEPGGLTNTYASHSVRPAGASSALKYMWFSMQPGGEDLDEQGVLFHLRVKARKKAASLQGLLWQGASESFNEAVFADGAEKARLSLQSAGTTDHGFVARLAGANPTHGDTQPTVYLPAAAELTISLLDLTGRLVGSQRVATNAG